MYTVYSSPSLPQDTDSAPLRVFTTRPETVFGVSYLAISPEHELLQNTQVGHTESINQPINLEESHTSY